MALFKIDSAFYYRIKKECLLIMNWLKRFYKPLIVGGLVILALGGCESKAQKQQKEQQEIQQHPRTNRQLQQDTNGQNYFQQDAQQRLIHQQQQKAIKDVSNQMGQNYKKIGTVSCNPKQNIITTNLKGKQMKALMIANKQGNKSAQKFLKQLSTGLQKTSTNISKQIKDPNLKFQLKDTNGKLIYQVTDGNVNIKRF